MFMSIFLSIILVTIIYLVNKRNKKPKVENLPHIPGFPAIWAILRQKNQDEVQNILSHYSKGHDVVYGYLGPISCITFTSPKYLKEFLMESEDAVPKVEFLPGSLQYQFFGKGLPFSNGDVWRTSRKLANPAFNLALSPEMVGETMMEFFTFMQQNLNRPIDTFELMQRITIEVLGRLAFGYRFGFLGSEVPHIISIYKHIISSLSSPYRYIFKWANKLPTKSNKRLFSAIDEFDRFIFDIIETKSNEINEKNSDRVDLLTSMLECSKQEGIHADAKQLRDEMVTFFAAGHDSTSMALSTSLYYLAKYPEIQEKARAEVINILGNEPVIPTSDQIKEMKYVNAIVKESLRIHPPLASSMLRKLAKPIKVGPYILPENVICSVNTWQIHHHPEHWENPEQYNPERFLNNEKRHPFCYLPFSAGPRNCLGSNFSLMEQKVFLSMSLLKYHWTLPENSINKDKLLLETNFLLKPVDLKLVFNERIH